MMNTWPYPKLFAHRGGGRLAPENTLAAMRMARALGYSAVEFDVKLSEDGIAMLMHDDTLQRTSDGVGNFREHSAAKLEQLDAGAWFGATFAGERIPRFSAVMQYLHTQGMNADIEIKPCPGRDAETGAMVAALARDLTMHHAVKPLMSSFSIAALRAARAAAPEMPLMLLAERMDMQIPALLRELACVAICLDYQIVSADLVSSLHAAGVRVLVYTVNRVDDVYTLDAIGVDGFCTDALEVMAKRYPQMLHC
jgi:glycerophosphoryl diester phosphodiesterase